MSNNYKLNKVINKWLPRFKYTSILTDDFNELTKDIDRLKLSLDDFITEVNKLTY